jgi:SAM-dependent methyltransferase
VHAQFDDGVMLPADAMATLRYIPLDHPPEPWSEISERNDEMWQLPQSGSSAAVPEEVAPPSALSTYSFTNLSIPSPGGFFSSLGHRARHTWAFPSASNPPSSATAEQFYNAPWNRVDGEIVEQVVECPVPVSAEDQLTAVPISAGPPTAIKITPEGEPAAESTAHPPSPETPVVEEVPAIGPPLAHYEYDESYADELKKLAVENLDRTSIWLASQESYLAALCETNPVNDTSSVSSTDGEKEEEEEESPEPALKKEKSVRFVEKTPDANDAPPSTSVSKDSIYWRGFQTILRQSRRRDAFLHSNMRFDAVQSVRLGLADKHIDGLLGKYELVQPERPPYKGPFSHSPRNTVAAELLEQRALFEKVEKEQAVLDQLNQSMWAMDALRYLNGGSLLSSPASKRLSAATEPLGSPESAGKRRIRVLDLGGEASCGWAWHLAHDHPNVKIYTVVTKQQVANNGIKGPSNHRQVSVPCLWKLPFRDNQFDVISARSLHALLKAERPVGEEMDEYDLCLQECYRCLKPGGYLEYFVMDSEIARAGPYGSAASVEFAFNLKTRGYDPAATKRYLSRLRRGHFVGIKRAWMFLPMGIEPVKSQAAPETLNPVSGQVHSMEAMHGPGPMGSTADVASMTGLLGGWAWEQWMLKLQMEMGRGREKLLEGIGSVFDEGRKNGSGWTCLCGWAMKPKRKRPTESNTEEAASFL